MTDNIPDTAETSQKPTEASGTTDTVLKLNRRII